MKTIAIVFGACLLIAGLALAPAAADDETSVERRLADLESRLARLEAQLARLEKLLAAVADAPPAPASESGDWTPLIDPAHLERELAAATKAGKPVVVFITATWCTYCKAYRELMDADPQVRTSLSSMVKLEVDVTQERRDDLRKALGVGAAQPLILFFDAEGQAVEKAAIRAWSGDGSAAALRASLALFGS